MALTLAGLTATHVIKVLDFEHQKGALGELGKELVLFKDIKNLAHVLDMFIFSSQIYKNIVHVHCQDILAKYL